MSTAATAAGPALNRQEAELLARRLRHLASQYVLVTDNEMEFDHQPDMFRATTGGLQLVMRFAGQDRLPCTFTLSEIGEPRFDVSFVPEAAFCERVARSMKPEHHIAAQSLCELAQGIWKTMNRLQPTLWPPLLNWSARSAREKDAIKALAHEMATQPKRRKVEVLREYGRVWGLRLFAMERVWRAAVILARETNPDHAWDRAGAPRGARRKPDGSVSRGVDVPDA